MVGLLGCGCCGQQITEPPYYGPCDCGTNTQTIRKDFQYGWDDPILDLPIFTRPNFNGHSYDKFIHSSRFYVASKTRFTFPAPPAAGYPLPYWNGYQGIYPWRGEEPATGYHLGLLPELSFNPALKLQFCWNEFDYEISYKIKIESGCKPVLWGQNIGGGIGRFAQIRAEPYFAHEPSDNSGNGIVIGAFAKYQFIQGGIISGPMPAYDWNIYVYSSSNANTLSQWSVPPVLKELQFDTFYTVKNVMRCPRLVYPNHGMITSEWFIDNQLIRKYQIETQKRGNWTKCDASYWRLLNCGKFFWVSSQVYPFAFYPENPALKVFTDDWEFKLLLKP